MSATYVALLRGINVGGKNKLPMQDLVEMFVEAGCDNVRSFIQSGNVIFSAAPGAPERLPSLISTRISKRFGYKIPLILRTAEQMGNVISNNPFLKAGAAEKELYVLFLADFRASRSVRDLDPDRSPPDAFKVRGQEIYLRLPNGGARTKLTNQYFDSKLRTTSTSRNWRTVTKLFELMEGQGSPNSAAEARKHRSER
jgi:uncharacterized protein (DUF1697 family)